ncbi:BamA/TamA family outer membrane protein [Parahaliea sp. F7430]|uniref:BamA/TamA family outer membrane protein n=1 Tax=Sediminihaliea albiluteola TaxID=2758564 RepID=A0A7W2YJM1_9GAMM|nr:BamA/TamA family outer membrane protein [Sediminihaliea albiluteola]
MAVVLTLFYLASPLSVNAEEACVEVPEQAASESFRFQPSPEHDALEKRLPQGLIVRSIRYQRFSVFDRDDPLENNWIYNWANDFHSVTREWVLNDHLLLEEGSVFEQHRAEESERILRNLKFIYDATVRPWRWCGNEVDIEVITRDIWTFTPSISFGRSGGENSSALGFRDSNFLGTGKQVLLEYDKDGDRSGYTLGYSDPSILGSRWEGRLRFTDNDDGYDHSLRLERPFFSVYEKWAAGGQVEQQKQEEKLWFRGDKVAEFQHEREDYRIYGGIAAHTEVDKRVDRWLFGYQYQNHEFSYSDSRRPPDALPEDRVYSYPFIGYQSVEDEFIELHNFQYLGRTEDVFVGERYRWSLGWSGESFGATRDQLVIDARYLNTLTATSKYLWVFETQLSGFWTLDDESFENLWWQLETRYHFKQSRNWLLYSGLRVDYSDGLTAEKQVTLGGENGLRGYDRNYQVGDRSVVWTLEQRYYSDWHPFRLFRVGLAAFIDVGRAWYQSEDNGSNGDVLADAGIGLRLNSSRAEKSAVIHIDLAFPFMRDDDVDDVQLLLTVKDRF